MFGGWTAAVMLGAVVRSAASTATPSALTVNFLGPIAPGGDVAVTTQRLGGGRSVEHWRADAR
jgi:acyl dehydratase